MLYTFKQCFLDSTILKLYFTRKRDLLSLTYTDECNIMHICIYVFTIGYIKKRKSSEATCYYRLNVTYPLKSSICDYH